MIKAEAGKKVFYDSIGSSQIGRASVYCKIYNSADVKV
jgi:hypothetical protein